MFLFFSLFLVSLSHFLLSQFFRSTNVLIYGLFSRTLQYFLSLSLSLYSFLFLCCFITFGSFIHSFVLSFTQSVTHSSSSPFLIDSRFTEREGERESISQKEQLHTDSSLQQPTLSSLSLHHCFVLNKKWRVRGSKRERERGNK